MKYPQLREQLVSTCKAMNASGINQGTSGNLSLRTEDGFLITPSGRPYDTMMPEDIVEMGFDGTYDGLRPSSEWRFHRDILKARDDINVVLHCHSIYATTLACHHKSIPSFHYMTGVAGGTDIRCADYATFGTQALSDNALIALKDRPARADLARKGSRLSALAGDRGRNAVAHLCTGTDARRAADPFRRGDAASDRADAAHELRPRAGPRRHQRCRQTSLTTTGRSSVSRNACRKALSG